jgi:hypothetical protein
MPGDDTVMCGLCDKVTSVAMISYHLITEHGFDRYEIESAPVYDMTEFEQLPRVWREGDDINGPAS